MSILHHVHRRKTEKLKGVRVYVPEDSCKFKWDQNLWEVEMEIVGGMYKYVDYDRKRNDQEGWEMFT